MNNSFNSSFTMPDVVLVKKVKLLAEDTEEKEKKAKSSGSKKREKRNRKQEKKMKNLATTMNRMGFGGGVGDDTAEPDPNIEESG